MITCGILILMMMKIKLLISKKINYLEPVLTVSTIKKLNKYFRKSLVIELYWEKEINYLN